MDQSEPSGAPQPSTAVVPSVVAVVVTHNPGPWFGEALSSLVDQDYRNLSILVIDAASAQDPTPRIAEVAPRAFVRRLEANPGFGAAASIALRLVEGAAFYLVCHDDVALGPAAVRLLVEEAYRSNAGVVGPKLVMWDEPERLLQVGQGGDQFGVPAPIAERGELDQEQHDAVRDVFSIPGGCVLVRADLLAALGGYDEAMAFHGEDVDLCWRAHIAGARVLVAPAARARHVEALAERGPADSRRLQARHRLRMVLTNYGLFYLVAVLARQVPLSLAEILAALVTGRFRQAGEVVAAYVWNLRSLGSVIAKRRRVRRVRQVPDLEIRRLQVRGSARLAAFVRGPLSGTSGRASGATLSDTGRQMMASIRGGLNAQNALVVAITVAVVAFGSRHLLTQRTPVIGELVPLPDRARDLLGEWWHGWRPIGLGVESSPPTGLAFFGIAGMVALGATDLVRSLAIIGLLPLGGLGAWRLGRFSGGDHSRAPVAALVAYLVNPLPYQALASGSWRGLAAFAACPWLLRRMALASRVEPFLAPAGKEGVVRQVAGFGLVLALCMVVYPAAAVLVGLMVGGLLLGSALVGRAGGLARMVAISAAGTATAVVAHLPWLVGAVRHHDPDATMAGRLGDPVEYSVARALRFAVGSSSTSRLTFGLFVAALLPLAIGRGWRLTWAARAWAIAALTWGLVAAERADLLHLRLPPGEVLLAPAAAALALAAALGAAAFETDLPGYRFGWRQVASFAAGVAIFGATLPPLAASFDGRWRMPRGGFDRTLRFQVAEAAERGAFRVLWVGNPAVLPAGAWPLPDAVGTGAYVTTFGPPATRNLWTGPETDSARLLPAALASAASGNTSRLGQLLAPMGVRYVIVSDQLAPQPFGGRREPADVRLADLLSGQLDLEEVDVNPALRVFRNAAWIPLAVDLGDAAGETNAARLAPGGLGAALQRVGVTAYDGTVSGSAVHLAEAYSPRWRLTVNGTAIDPTVGFGWANRFAVTSPPAGAEATARIGYHVPGRRVVANIAQLVFWLLLIVAALRQGPAAGASLGWRARRSAAKQRSAAPTLIVGDGERLVTRPLAVGEATTEPPVTAVAGPGPVVPSAAVTGRLGDAVAGRQRAVRSAAMAAAEPAEAGEEPSPLEVGESADVEPAEGSGGAAPQGPERAVPVQAHTGPVAAVVAPADDDEWSAGGWPRSGEWPSDDFPDDADPFDPVTDAGWTAPPSAEQPSPTEPGTPGITGETTDRETTDRETTDRDRPDAASPLSVEPGAASPPTGPATPKARSGRSSKGPKRAGPADEGSAKAPRARAPRRPPDEPLKGT